jgi:polyvinyl alcohol dehydrogenase (cytochrome)
LVWSNNIGPGGHLGGIMWNIATDGALIYTSITNRNITALKLGIQNSTGYWAALNGTTGDIVWTTDDPNGFVSAPVTVLSSGIVVGGSWDSNGTVYAFNSSTGEVLWSYQTGGSVQSGPSIVDGVIYLGTGYERYDYPATGNKKIYAFALPSNVTGFSVAPFSATIAGTSQPSSSSQLSGKNNARAASSGLDISYSLVLAMILVYFNL